MNYILFFVHAHMGDEGNEAMARNRALTRGRSLPSYCLFDESSVGPPARWPVWWATHWSSEWDRLARRAEATLMPRHAGAGAALRWGQGSTELN